LKLDLYKEAISEDEEGCQSLQETSLGNEMNEQDGENMLVKLEDCSETQILTEEIDIKSIKDQEFKDRTELTHPIPAFFNEYFFIFQISLIQLPYDLIYFFLRFKNI